MLTNKQLLIIGAGGHGRVAAEIARLQGYEVSFLDDNPPAGINVVGPVHDADRYMNQAQFFVAIGNNEVRRKIQRNLLDRSARIVTLVHPNAVVSSDAHIGTGSIVMAGAVINAGAQIGEGVIVNTCSSVDHDCVIHDYAHVSVGAHLAGTVVVGSNMAPNMIPARRNIHQHFVPR